MSHGTQLLPPCDSATGTPCRSAKARNSAPAWLYSTPPPATINGWRAAASSVTARASSAASGGGRRKRIGSGCRKLSGQSNAIACTSCGSESVTGPHIAGSVMTWIARGSATRICSGRVMRSK